MSENRPQISPYRRQNAKDRFSQATMPFQTPKKPFRQMSKCSLLFQKPFPQTSRYPQRFMKAHPQATKRFQMFMYANSPYTKPLLKTMKPLRQTPKRFRMVLDVYKQTEIFNPGCSEPRRRSFSTGYPEANRHRHFSDSGKRIRLSHRQPLSRSRIWHIRRLG